jgi:hypothetical protein
MSKENKGGTSKEEIKKENNINIINITEPSILTNNENNDNNEFKDIKEKIAWKHYEQKAFHLKPDLERVWFLIQKFDFLLLIHNKGHYPVIFIKGDDTKKVNNIFKGSFYGKIPFIAKVNKIQDFPEYKKIEWLFHLKNQSYMSIKISLLKVTEDNSTTLIFKIKLEKQEEFIEINKLFPLDKAKIFKTIERILENEPINLVIYESGLVNGKMEDIWAIITDFNKLAAIAPNNNFPSNINLRTLKKEERIPVSIMDKNGLQEFYLQLNCREEKPGWNKWLIICSFLKKNTDCLNESLLIQLKKINNNLCQFTIIEKHFKAKNAEEFREISKKIKYIILSVKDYFDNFFSPNND